MVLLMLVASSCSRESTSEDESTSTIAVEVEEAEVAAGDPPVSDVVPVVGEFAWTEVLDVSEGFIQSVAMTDDGFYAVARTHMDGFYSPTRVWTSEDGTEWTEVDASVFGSGANIHSVVAGGPGVVAAGFVPDGDSYSAMVWTSGDGSSWQSRSLGYTVPEPTAEYRVSYLGLDAVAAGPDHGLVAGVQHEGLDWQAAHDAVVSALPPGVADLPDDRIGTNPESVNVRVGPFAVFTATYDDLGIDPAVGDAFADMGGPSSEELFVFGSQDLEEWEPIDVTAVSPSSVQFMSELLWSGSTYVASVWGYGPGNLVVSQDGMTWDEATLPEGVQDLAGVYLQGDRLIGDAWASEARILLTSSDGREWSKLGPLPGMIGTIGAGDLGIVAEGWGENGGWCSPETMEPTIVESQDGTLTVSRSTITITSPSGDVVMEEPALVANPMWGEDLDLPEAAIVDYESQTVEFATDGASTMTVAFAELEAAFREACESSPGCCPFPTTQAGSVIYFSADGLEWTSQDMADTPIEGSLTGIAVGTDRAIITTVEESDNGMTSRLWLGMPTSEEADDVALAPSVDLPAAAMDGNAPEGDVVLRLPTGQVPRTLATADGVSLVITAAEVGSAAGPTRAWVSLDNTGWNELDPEAFGRGASVDLAVAGGPGLVAVGTLPSDGVTRATAWTSVDGLEWVSTPLGVVLEPADVPGFQSMIHYASVAAGPDGALVMADQSTGFAWQLLEPTVAEALPEGLDDADRMMIDPDRVEVLWGPFVVLSEQVKDLDVDQEVFDAYRQSVSGVDDRRSVAFTTEDYQTWTATEIDETYWSVAPGLGGYVAATWSAGGECPMRQSTDGVVWSEAPCPVGALEVFQVAGGPETLYATGSTTSGRTVWKSDDGGYTWDAIGLLPGNAHEISVGTAGIASAGESGEDEWLPLEMREPTVIEVDGYTMTIESGEGGFEVLDGQGDVVVSETLSTASYHGDAYDLPASLDIDAASQTLAVVDESGTEHVTITLEQLEDAACGPGGMCLHTPPSSVLWFSTDGELWSEQPLVDLVGYDAFAWNQLIAVADTILVTPVPIDDDDGAAVWRGFAGQ